uniref:Protein E6 n=1 Tax=Human papillomavirus TaxID=10566 RepID=A0A385PM71_9PAPI|nr:MAG: E6 protein [Human papillomavirus]
MAQQTTPDQQKPKEETFELPTTIKELADLLQIPLVDCLVPCNFCGRFLDFLEVCEFDKKQLTLIWKDYFVSACCRSCCVATATFEFNEYYQQTVLGRDIELATGKSIFELKIRCQTCLSFLSTIEKLDSCGRGFPFHKVRDGWKGVCRHCKHLYNDR